MPRATMRVGAASLDQLLARQCLEEFGLYPRRYTSWDQIPDSVVCTPRVTLVGFLRKRDEVLARYVVKLWRRAVGNRRMFNHGTLQASLTAAEWHLQWVTARPPRTNPTGCWMRSGPCTTEPKFWVGPRTDEEVLRAIFSYVHLAEASIMNLFDSDNDRDNWLAEYERRNQDINDAVNEAYEEATP